MTQEIEQRLKHQKLREPGAALDERRRALFEADAESAQSVDAAPMLFRKPRRFFNPTFARAAALIIALPALGWFANSALHPDATTTDSPSGASANLSTNPLPNSLDSMIRFDHTVTRVTPGRPMLATITPTTPTTTPPSEASNTGSSSTPPPTTSPPDDPATRDLFPTLENPANVPTVIRPMYEHHVNYTRWHDPETGVTIEHARPRQNVRYITLPVY
jgi:hypothetical protein